MSVPLVPARVRLSEDLRDGARQLLDDAIAHAAPLMTDVDAYRYAQLARVVLDDLLEQRLARHGLKITELAKRGRIAKSKLPECFGTSWHAFTDVVVRDICLRIDRPPIYEEIFSLPVVVGRADNSLGTDRCPGVHNSLHVLVWAVASQDLHCATLARPLTTGTRDDRTSSRRSSERIAAYREQLGVPVPATIGENLRNLLRGGYYTAKAIETDPKKRRFSKYLLIGELPYGPPDKSHLDSYDTLAPGRDDEVVTAVYDDRRLGILYAGTPSPTLDGDENAYSLDSTFVRWSPEGLWAAAMSEFREPLNINRPWNVQYLWSAERHLLYRQAGGRAEFWRLVGLEDLPVAAGFIEHNAQHEWPSECMGRWAADAAAGQIGARHPRTREGCMDLLNAANAAAVGAERLRRQHEHNR